jgi:tetratricopeptide (TPR) repeat protein
VSSDATPADIDGYLQRAELLADLGRYEDAATELGYAIALNPGEVRALTLLARVHLAAGRPGEALAAADAAVAAHADPLRPELGAPGLLPALVIRGHALADLRRFAEAAQTAEQILTLGPDDAYAQRSGAAILAESRNGQQALNAAWRGVELAPEESEAHLVLALVSARLRLFDLAERAYREALRLDPELATAQHDVGVVRLEQRRYAEALADLAEAAVLSPESIDSPRAAGNALAHLVLYGAGYSLIAAVSVAFLAAASEGVSRVWAALLAIAGLVIVGVLGSRVPRPVTAILPELLRSDRALGLAVCATAAAPFLFLVYTLVGTPWPLVLAIAVTAVAELTVLIRARY